VSLKSKEYKRWWQENNREKVNKANKKWREKNIKYIKEYKKQYYQNNHNKILEKSKQYQKDNINKVLEYQKKYKSIKNKIDSRFNLNNKIRRAINHSLKEGNKNSKYWKILGYVKSDLIKFLKSTIPKGYTWQDYLNGKLQVDHIKPKSIFNYSKIEHVDFKRCWALSNLRLLPAKENLIKGKKLCRPFQPALRLKIY